MNLSIEPTLTTRQLAETVGASESSIKRWIDQGEILAYRTGGGHRRVPRAEAIRFIRQTGAVVNDPTPLSLRCRPLLGPIDDFASDHFFGALLRDEPDEAEALVSGRFISGATIAAIGDGLIQPALARIGEIWRHKPSGVLQEHRSLDTCVRIVVQLQGWLPTPASTDPVVITAAGPEDPHILPPLLASLTLRERGVHSRNLGPRTPVETIALAIDRYQACACVLSFRISPSDDSSWEPLLQRLESGAIPLLMGGRASDSLPQRLAGSGLWYESLVQLGSLTIDLIKRTTCRKGAHGPAEEDQR